MKLTRINTPEPQAFETAHTAQARALASECMVLLENDGTLPIAKGGKIAVYGSGARSTIKGGTGSGDVNTRDYVTVEKGLENAGFTITTKAWMDAYGQAVLTQKKAFYGELRKQADAAGVSPLLFAMGHICPEPEYEFPIDGEGDSALYVLARISGEGADRTPTVGDINLTESEIRDINLCSRKYKNFILVLNCGGIVDLTPVKDVKAVLLMGQLGIATGDALVDVLIGTSVPSGKLTTTWAPIKDYPSTVGFGHMDDTDYKEGVYVGYRYFDTIGYQPTYPFGYGLSYTDFDITTESVTAADGRVHVTARVTNTGNYSGKEVAQVYYSAPDGKIDKPYQELAAYAKTSELAPGESEELNISYPVTDMASYDTTRSAWVMEPGTYLIRVGNSSRNTTAAAALVLDSEAITEQDKPIVCEPSFKDLIPEKSSKSQLFARGIEGEVPVIPLSASDIQGNIISYAGAPEEIPSTSPVMWSEVMDRSKTIDQFVAGLTDEQLAFLCVGDYKSDSDDIMEAVGNASSSVAGAAGETSGKLKELGLPTLVMADGPAGLRLSKEYHVENDIAKGGSSLGGDMMLVFTPEELAAMAAAATPASQASEGDSASETYYQYCTAIPIGTEIAQSWNDKLAETLGDLVGSEMEIFGCPIWLAPALNIHRSPLCGRNFEYYSEDPVIAGRMAAAITRGVQSHPGCATTVKHYAFNNQETNRYFSSSNLSERAMREIYLKGFEICIKDAQPHYLMTSYNLVNGLEHTCNNYDLQTAVLRDEWGFKGVVMTDWLVTGGMTSLSQKYGTASAAGCVKAGNDITMPGTRADKDDILKALADENHPYHLTRGQLQACAKRVLQMTFEMLTAK